MPAKKTGRPSLPPDDRRRFTLQVQVKRAELAWVKGAADRAGMSVSAFCRARILGPMADGPRKRRGPSS